MERALQIVQILATLGVLFLIPWYLSAYRTGDGILI